MPPPRTLDERKTSLQRWKHLFSRIFHYMACAANAAMRIQQLMLRSPKLIATIFDTEMLRPYVDMYQSFRRSGAVGPAGTVKVNERLDYPKDRSHCRHVSGLREYRARYQKVGSTKYQICDQCGSRWVLDGDKWKEIEARAAPNSYKTVAAPTRPGPPAAQASSSLRCSEQRRQPWASSEESTPGQDDFQINASRGKSYPVVTGLPGTLSQPDCPKCSNNMVPRYNGEDGSLFWGCPRFPECLGARRMVTAEGKLAAKPEAQPGRGSKAAASSSGRSADTDGFETIHLPDRDMKDLPVEDESISVESLTDSEPDY